MSTPYWCDPTVQDLRLGSATFGTALHQEARMPTEPAFFVPAAAQAVRRMTSPMPTVVMHLTAYGDDAEASMRQMCSGLLPVVGQRYVWVCTDVTTIDGRIQAEFQLHSLGPE